MNTTVVVPKSKKSTEQPKKHAIKLRSIADIRRRKIIEAVMDGKPLKQAGIEAGLSPKTADTQVSQIIKHPKVQESFVRILERSGLTDDKLSAKLSELIDAKGSHFFATREGQITEKQSPAWETQRKTTELLCKLKGHLAEQTGDTTNIAIMSMVVSAIRNPQ